MRSPFLETLPASECVARLREMLKSGGCAVITVGNEERHLKFHPLFHRPISRLPWPLSKLQPQGCDILIMAANQNPIGMMSSDIKILRRHDYSRSSQHNEAITTFLQGADPEEEVFFHKID